MNWVGGARKRVKLQGEKKLQKEFFERKKLEAKPWKKSKRSPVLKQSFVSRDLLALQTVSNIQCSPQDAPKSVRKLDLDQFRSTVMGRRCNEIELPSSPNETPSMIHLYEKGCFSSGRTSSSQSLRHRTDSKPVLPQCKNTEKLQTKVKLESRQGSSQHNISHNKHLLLDPFKKSFNQSSPVLAKKSCLKLNCDNYRKSAHDHPDFPSHSIGSGKVNQTRPGGIVFDPWAVEDFQATPLVNYESTDKRGPCPSQDSYRSLKDAGYITDQERFHKIKPASQLQNFKERKENPRYRPVSMETFEISLDHNPKKSNPVCGVGDSVNDIYDEYIENRFRGPKPLFSRSNGKRNSDKRTVDVDSSSKQKLLQFCNNGNRFESGKDCSIHDVFKKSSTPRQYVDTQGTYSMFSDTRRHTSNTTAAFQSRKEEKSGSMLGYGTARKREDETKKRYSPIEGDLFPNVRLCPEEFNFIKHAVREPSNSIKSVGSTSSSCSDTRIINHKEDLSDLESDTQGSMLLCSDSLLISDEKKTRLKTSSVDEVLEEALHRLVPKHLTDLRVSYEPIRKMPLVPMPEEPEMEKLESESEDVGRDNERYDITQVQRGAADIPDPGAAMINAKQGETADDDDDDLDEVSQVLQELVHKVVLLNSQTLTDHDNLAFVIPSRSITVTPWKMFKSLYADTAVRSHTSVTLCQESPVCIKKEASGKVHQQSLDDARITSKQVRLVKPDSQSTRDIDHKTANCAVTPNWNKLNLVSPLAKPSSCSLPQSFVDTSVDKGCSQFSTQSMTFEEKILQSQTLTEEILTPKKSLSPAYDSVGTVEKVHRLITPKKTDSTCPKTSGIPLHNSTALATKVKTDPHLNQNVLSGPKSVVSPISVFNSNSQTIINEKQINSEAKPLVKTDCQTFHPAASTHFGLLLPPGETKNKTQVSDMSTQTYLMSTADSSTSPVQFMRPELVDAATQYDAEDDAPVLLNESEVSMEQGDSQELMDCTVPIEVGPAEWTINDSMLESLSQSDVGTGYALRSRKK